MSCNNAQNVFLGLIKSLKAVLFSLNGNNVKRWRLYHVKSSGIVNFMKRKYEIYISKINVLFIYEILINFKYFKPRISNVHKTYSLNFIIYKIHRDIMLIK